MEISKMSLKVVVEIDTSIKNDNPEELTILANDQSGNLLEISELGKKYLFKFFEVDCVKEFFSQIKKLPWIQFIEVVTIEQLTSPAHSVITLYKDIFAEEPEYQYWSESQVEQMFRKYIEKGFFLVRGTTDWPNAFIAAVSLKDYSIELPKNIAIDKRTAWYIADLGVHSAYRRRGVGRQMMIECLEKIPVNADVLIRVSEVRKSAIALYQAMGFEFIEAEPQIVEYSQVGGGMIATRKRFLIKRA